MITAGLSTDKSDFIKQLAGFWSMAWRVTPANCCS